MDGSGFDFEEGIREMSARLQSLEAEHRDLDRLITEVQTSADLLTLQRLKRSKLRMRDEISRLRGLLYPDIIA
ncbi:MAG: hypothetical protein CMK09_02600 [Ponticaulis sp.]|nr:hypothetical protein [Ponticaulis sp.]|tara:strand:+ start:30807 stop:31025 length:219 start_codon:yes stop_codon:yes gene_type:complete